MISICLIVKQSKKAPIKVLFLWSIKLKRTFCQYCSKLALLQRLLAFNLIKLLLWHSAKPATLQTQSTIYKKELKHRYKLIALSVPSFYFICINLK